MRTYLQLIYVFFLPGILSASSFCFNIDTTTSDDSKKLFLSFNADYIRNLEAPNDRFKYKKNGVGMNLVTHYSINSKVNLCLGVSASDIGTHRIYAMFFQNELFLLKKGFSPFLRLGYGFAYSKNRENLNLNRWAEFYQLGCGFRVPVEKNHFILISANYRGQFLTYYSTKSVGGPGWGMGNPNPGMLIKYQVNDFFNFFHFNIGFMF